MSAAPVNLGPSWRYIALRRATEDEPRRPMLCLPETLENAPPEKVEAHRRFWGGIPLAWNGLTDTVENQGLDIGIVPELNDLVMLDCDVKTYDPETGFVAQPDGSYRLAPPVVKRGIDDLKRVVEGLGHSIAELATYAVCTKSGGVHLYFRKNPRYPLPTTGHRQDWRVDVIGSNGGSNRSWAAAPPTPGYRVVRDLPVIELPDWLGARLMNLRANTEPLGGRRRWRLDDDGRRLRTELRDGGATTGTGDGLLTHYYRLVLSQVAVANRYGGWNNTIYDAAHALFDTGAPLGEVKGALLKAAAPWNEREERAAVQTIESAWRKNQRGRHDERRGAAR